MRVFLNLYWYISITNKKKDFFFWINLKQLQINLLHCLATVYQPRIFLNRQAALTLINSLKSSCSPIKVMISWSDRKINWRCKGRFLFSTLFTNYAENQDSNNNYYSHLNTHTMTITVFDEIYQVFMLYTKLRENVF